MCIDTGDADVGIDIDTGIDLIVAFVYKVTILSHYPNICHFSVFKDYKTYITKWFSLKCWDTPVPSVLWRLRQKLVYPVHPGYAVRTQIKQPKERNRVVSCLTTL